MMMSNPIDAASNAGLQFGYPWWLSYGHLVVTLVSAAVLGLAVLRRWPRWLLAVLGAFTLWAGVSFVIARFVFDINGRAALPTEAFLRSGQGRVLDMGAGTGRSSIMVLEARPGTTLVALDLFSESFDQHFGNSAAHHDTPQDRLLANLQAAGVAQRTTIQTGDMRHLPFPAASFDAVVSSYAIDHLGRAGIDEALGEAARVLRPDGEFLLSVIGKEPWLQFAFGPLLMHGLQRDTNWWLTRLQTAGFAVTERGTRPATLYFLARRHGATPSPVQ